MPSAVTPWIQPAGPAMPLGLLLRRLARRGGDDMRAASFSVSFVDLVVDRGQQPSPSIGIDRLGRADRLGLTARHLAGLQRLERVRRRLDHLRRLQQAHRVTHTHARHVIQPVRRRTMPTALPQIGLRHPTCRQRDARRGEVLQPGELRHQLHRVTSTGQTRGRTRRPTTRRNRRRTRPPGPAFRTPIAPWIAPSNPCHQPYSGGVTAPRGGTTYPAVSGGGGGRARARAGWRSARRPD